MKVCGLKEKRKRFTVVCEYGRLNCDDVKIDEDWVTCTGTDIKFTTDDNNDKVIGGVLVSILNKSVVISIDENVWEEDAND